MTPRAAPLPHFLSPGHHPARPRCRRPPGRPLRRRCPPGLAQAPRPARPARPARPGRPVMLLSFALMPTIATSQGVILFGLESSQPKHNFFSWFVALVVTAVAFRGVVAFCSDCCRFKRRVHSKTQERAKQQESPRVLFVSPQGEKYHLSRDCRGLRAAQRISRREPCMLCAGQAASPAHQP